MAKTFKKFLALALVLSLVMGMTGFAYAADEDILDDEPLPVEDATDVGYTPTEDGEKLETTFVTDEVAAEVTEGSVAKIGDVGYATLQAAIDAADEGDTVTLLKDDTYGATIPAGKTITLNVPAGITLSNENSTVTGSWTQSVLINKGNLTLNCEGNLETKQGKGGFCLWNDVGGVANINGGTFTTYNGDYIIFNHGTATIDGATLNKPLHGASYAIIANGRDKPAVLTIEECTVNDTSNVGIPVCNYGSGAVTINGGTFAGQIPVQNGGTAVINGGTFIKNYNDPTDKDEELGLILEYGKLTINGGNFCNGTSNKAVNVFCNYSVSKNDDITITGGTFFTDPTDYVAEGYIATENTDSSTWTVVRDAAYWVAKIEETGVEYATLQAAITAAGNGDTVTLLKDAAENVTIANGQSITLNIPADVTLSNSGKSHTIMVNYGGKLTVVGSGIIANANNKAALFNRGTVILSGAEITCTSTAAERWYIIANHGDMTIQENAKVIASTAQASMIWNGYHNYMGTTLTGTANDGYIEGKNHAFPKLTITGGIVKSEDNTAIKNEDGGILEISGNPEISGATNLAIFNCHVADISGGTFTGPIGNYRSATYKSASGEELNSGALTITGGEFYNAYGHNFQMYDAEPIHGEKIQISGGTFGGCDWSLGKDCFADGCMNADSYDKCRDNGVCYVATDYLARDNNDGTWTVVPNYVARVGANDYMTIAEAIAVNGGNNQPFTVTLLRSTSETVVIPADKTVTLDLGEKTLNGKITVDKSANLTVNDGTITAATQAAIQVRSNGSLTLNNCNAGGVYYSVMISVDGKNASGGYIYTTNATININGGKYKGLSTNGSSSGHTINVTDGTFSASYLAAGNSTYNISGGSFDAGIYAAALEIDAGTLNISGEATFTCNLDTSTNIDNTYTNNNGSGGFRGALVVCKPASSSTTAYAGDAVVNIYGGTFTNKNSDDSDAIVIADFGKDENGAGKAEVNIHNGSVYGQLSVYRPEGQNNDAKLELTGGDYTSNETEFCASGYRCTQRADERWIVSRIPTTPVTPVTPSTPDEPDEPIVDIEDDPTALGDRPFIFEDVHENDWFYDEVKNIFEHGLINGTTTTTYEPQTELTRGMIVTILWRIAGEPTVETTSTFTDVPENAYYFDAINWGAANNIARGYDEETFAPDRLVSREELAALIYRYAELIELDLTGIDDEAFAEFSDAETVLPWFVENMKWAISAGIVKGDNGMLLPQDRATRAEAAAMVNRFIQIPEIAAVMQANAEAEAATDAE